MMFSSLNPNGETTVDSAPRSSAEPREVTRHTPRTATVFGRASEFPFFFARYMTFESDPKSLLVERVTISPTNVDSQSEKVCFAT